MHTIFNCLIENKEWLFSGIGVLVLTWIFSVIRLRGKKDDNITIKQINKDNASGTQIGVQNNYHEKESSGGRNKKN